ncbi:MFS transporter [Burkholderia pyrrocinia]|uniref:MFS transporter n=1 Tax=Burkholderia sp. IT-111MI5 TaxID=3026439 RepID=UPI002A2DA420|nr:MFS transporter [Burkholderia pyrrocinia]EKS9897597.1 MFS transporter [Burkholderia pyrrocinia]EKS9910186.1 MFS transporter [Burkholderia pyrrocinia]
MKADVTLALGASTEALHEDALYRKVILRIVPLFFLGFIMSYLDRVNIGFAKLQMAADFGLTNASFALGASVFFWGYMLFEIPSNLILRRVGARAWIARIMITWGIVSTLMIFSRNEAAFYSLRFLLGVCEAGFVPGVMYYTNTWLPVRRQSGMYSLFLMALPIAVVFGAPLSGAIMETMDGVAGVRGWQWLFLLEGLPSAVLGVVILALLRNRPADVDWLTPREKQIIEANVAKEAAFKSHRVADAFRTPKIYALIVVMILFNTAFYGLTFWMPTLFHDAGVANSLDVGLFTAIPFGVAAICMYMNAKVAERSGRLRRHGVVPVALAAVGLFVATVAHDSFWLALIMLTVATSGILSLMPIYWTLPGRVLSSAAAAAGLALINACGSLSGILGAMIIGYAGIRTGMAILAGFLLLCSVVFYRVCPPTAE